MMLTTFPTLADAIERGLTLGYETRRDHLVRTAGDWEGCALGLAYLGARGTDGDWPGWDERFSPHTLYARLHEDFPEARATVAFAPHIPAAFIPDGGLLWFIDTLHRNGIKDAKGIVALLRSGLEVTGERL